MAQLILKKLFIAMLLLVIAAGCQKPFDPGKLDNEKELPIIEGFVNDGPGPYYVKIYYARRYNKDIKNEPLSDAHVEIKDDHGNIAVLQEKQKGFYYTDVGDIQGIQGYKYQLTIEIPDGSIIQSTEEEMNILPDNIYTYANVETKEYYNKDLYGKLKTWEETGLGFYMDCSLRKKNKLYLRLDTKIVTQKTREIYPGSISPIHVYCWYTSNLGETRTLNSSYFNGGFEIIKKQNLGFAAYNIDLSDPYDTISPPIPAGWIIYSTVYSISEKAYYYYEQINKQLIAEERIFDPIPTQITGNLTNITDPQKPCIGVFEVASKVTLIKGFLLKQNKKSMLNMDLPDYQLPGPDNCQDTTAPDFWITFE